jgi:uncharacterized protein YbjT (DUF2867 family)
MRVAVAGGSGLAGRHTVRALQQGGHEAIVLARRAGVDLETGRGLDAAVSGVDAVIDVTNTPSSDPAGARRFFSAVTRRLLAGEQRAEVRHHVVLSIAAVDRIENNGHYVGKRVQEELAQRGPTPTTIGPPSSISSRRWCSAGLGKTTRP